MKPDWDKLMEDFKDHATVLVGDVDCEGSGKVLCTTHNIEGFPTLKHGAPDALSDYDGERDLESLQEFASNLKPSCGPDNLDLCNEEERKEMDKVLAMSKEDLSKEIEKADQAIQDIEKAFEAEIDNLQKEYESLELTKTTKIAEIESKGLKNLKKVFVHKGGELKVRDFSPSDPSAPAAPDHAEL